MNALNSFEIDFVHRFHDVLSCDFLDGIMPIITALTNAGILWIALALIFLFTKKTRRMGLTMGIALILGLVVGNLILKPMIGRVRPYDFDPTITLLIQPERDFCFPSGHSLAAFEGAVSIFLYNKKWGIPALALAVLTALSRLYLQVHYPLDILCGSILGTAFALMAYAIVKNIKNERYL